jgi:hypothetical protein
LKGFSHGFLSDDVVLNILTQSSGTESEYLNLTPESRSGETRIESVRLRTLKRIQRTLKDGCVTGKREGWLRSILTIVEIK